MNDSNHYHLRVSKSFVAIFQVTYPVLSETFIDREIRELHRQGLPLAVYSLWNWKKPRAWDSPFAIRYFRPWDALRILWTLPREILRKPSIFWKGVRLLRQYRHASMANVVETLWGVCFAFCCADEIRKQGFTHLHAGWATGPATAAAVLSELCGVPFSFAAHAFDLYRHGGDAWLRAKLRSARFVHTTTEENVRRLRAQCPKAEILLARHGLDRLPEKIREPRVLVGEPVRLLSVGRLVAKKGHVHQLRAIQELLRRGHQVEAKIVGGGALMQKLRDEMTRLGLGKSVELFGALEHAEVQKLFEWADIFWHTGQVDACGDRDGLPNVIPEAMAHGLPVICCALEGATEAARHDETAWVTDVTNPALLADAVEKLAGDKELRSRLGRNGREWVEKNFLIKKNAASLAERMQS
ncbi:MAG: glycosyltransferase family 4 protein [bacterium]